VLVGRIIVVNDEALPVTATAVITTTIVTITMTILSLQARMHCRSLQRRSLITAVAPSPSDMCREVETVAAEAIRGALQGTFQGTFQGMFRGVVRVAHKADQPVASLKVVLAVLTMMQGAQDHL
jgi:hypothetical protein